MGSRPCRCFDFPVTATSAPVEVVSTLNEEVIATCEGLATMPFGVESPAATSYIDDPTPTPPCSPPSPECVRAYRASSRNMNDLTTVRPSVIQRHCASGEGRNFQSLARPRRRARRSPVPPLDQLRVPPARHTLFAPQRARKPCCKLIIIAAALCAARASAQNPPSDDLQRESFCSAKLCCNEEFRWL